MAKSRSVVCKMVLFVSIAIVANLLSFSADAELAAVPPPPRVQYPECNSTAVPFSSDQPECDACCTKAGHPGGYVKGGQCICNSG